MKKILIGLGILLLCVGSFIFLKKPEQTEGLPVPTPTITQPPKTGFRITSPVYAEGGYIPAQYTCDGENISPPLEIHDIPEKTMSLVLIIDDIDTPKGTWVHWMLWNILPESPVIAPGTTPPGTVVGKNGFGKFAYGGPCPQTGLHRYMATVYALDTFLSIPPESDKETLVRNMNTHVLGKATLMGLYKK